MTFVASVLVGTIGAVAAGASASKGKSATAGISGHEVTVGGGEIATGSANFLITYTYGVQAYFDTVDAHGGIDGYKFHYVAYDNANESSQGLSVIRRLVAGGVFALVGDVGQVPGLAEQSTILADKIPDIAPGYGGDSYWMKNQPAPSGYYFLQTPYIWGVQALARYLSSHGAKKIGLLYGTTEVGTEVLAGFKAYAAHNPSMVAGPEEEVAPTAVNMTSYVVPEEQAHVQAIIEYPGAETQLANTETEVQQAGDHMLYGAPFYAASTSLFSLTHGLADGITYFDSYMVPPTSSSAKAFDAAMTKYFPKAGVSLLTEQGYASATLFGVAFAKAAAGRQAPTRQRLEKALDALDGASSGVIKDVGFKRSHIGGLYEGILKATKGTKFVEAQGFKADPQNK